MPSHLRAGTILVAVLAAAAACGGEETAPENHAEPVDAKLFVSGTEVTPSLTLMAGQTVRIEVRFYADDGDQITGLETEHYTALTFSPATLASTAAVSGLRFFVDVTAQSTPGTGTVMVGFGHDDLADELSFGPFDVTVQ
jgi:hypothetical protein